MMRLKVFLAILLFSTPLFAAENVKAFGPVSKANIKAVGAVAEANIKAVGAVDNTASGGGFSPEAVTFDGANDIMEKSAQFTGSSDTGVGILSVWLNFNGGDGSIQHIMRWGAQSFHLSRTAANKINILCRNGGGTVIINVTSAASVTASSGWTHILASWNTAATAVFQLYINDSVDSATVTTLTTGATADWNGGGGTIGADHIDEGKLNACISEFYLNCDEYLDISSGPNRAKFISSGNPVDLGSNGSTPTGSQPDMYLKGAFGAYTVNSGTGGNFDTLTGALTTCTAP